MQRNIDMVADGAISWATEARAEMFRSFFLRFG